MEFEEVLKQRRSVREFLEKPVPSELVQKILELANLAPSAGNLQARKVILVKEEKLKEELARAAGHQNFVAKAPVVLVICAAPAESAVRYGERGRELFALQDATIFASYLQLVAANLGLSSCWVGAFEERQIKKILSLPEDLKPIAILPLGYPSVEPETRPRKNLSEIVIS